MARSKAVALFLILMASLAVVSIRPPTPADAYTHSGCKDPDGRFGYVFNNGTADITGTGEQQAVFTAMRLWEQVSNVEFGPPKPFVPAETEISWVTGAHGDTEDFKGPLGVKAHAFNYCNGAFNMDLHFDDDEQWIDGPGLLEQPSDVVAIGAHELGHILGFNHTTDEYAVMTNGQYSRRSLAWDDIFGVQLIYGRSYSNYHLKESLAGGSPSRSFEYGGFNDRPVAGDWNADGVDSIGVWRPSNAQFTLHNGSPGGTSYVFKYGTSGDRPIAGDWDGNGSSTIGIFRPSNTTFYLEDSHSAGSSEWYFSFGKVSDLPVAGDWDGDGFDSVGVFRPGTGEFFLRNQKSAGPADLEFTFGMSGDLPVVGDWDNDGDDTVGIYRPSKGILQLRNTNGSGAADLELAYGVNNLGQVVTPAAPVAGDWDGDGDTEHGLYQN